MKGWANGLQQVSKRIEHFVIGFPGTHYYYYTGIFTASGATEGMNESEFDNESCYVRPGLMVSLCRASTAATTTTAAVVVVVMVQFFGPVDIIHACNGVVLLCCFISSIDGRGGTAGGSRAKVLFVFIGGVVVMAVGWRRRL